MLLRNSVGPCRAQRHHRQPGLHELVILGPVGLHARSTARLARGGIIPLECKAEPRAVAFERVIVNDDTDTRALLLNLCDFRSVGFPCDRPVACFIVPDVVFPDAAGDEVELALMPNPLPAVEEIAHRHVVERRKSLLCYQE
jgi:hypothetical protein